MFHANPNTVDIAKQVLHVILRKTCIGIFLKCPLNWNHWIVLKNIYDLVFPKLTFASIDWYQLSSICKELITNRTCHSTESTKLFIYLKLKDSRWIWRLKTRLYFYGYRPTDHTKPSRKLSFSKTLFKPEEFENDSFAFDCEREKKNSKTLALQ